jgi:hypothetical protein
VASVLGLPAALVKQLLVRVAIGQAQAKALLSRHHPRVVLLATQHHWSQRALILGCKDLGIPTVFVPHAPTMLHLSYSDMPVDYALLRSVKDRDHYVSLGANPAQLAVVGDPSIDFVWGGTEISYSLVFGTSGWSSHELQQQIGVIAEGAGGRQVLVAPHPAGDRKQLRKMVPTAWDIHPESGHKLLHEGVGTLITAGSGLGLEALVQGASVVNLVLSPKMKLYLFHEDPSIRHVATPDQMRIALDAQVVDPMRGRAWVASIGVEAASLAAERLSSVAPATSPAVDVWKGPFLL